MLDEPDFEPEFYKEQVKMMEARYSKHFIQWKISWNKYRKYIETSLRNDLYWIWVYYCGFEKFLQETHGRPVITVLYKDADSRIARIIGDSFKVKNYINTL